MDNKKHITILSLLNVFIFKKIIDKKFNLKQIDSLLISSTLLLLPIFRSSAFWGLTENFGWLFLLLSISFFLNQFLFQLKKYILILKLVLNCIVFHSFLLHLFNLPHPHFFTKRWYYSLYPTPLQLI